MDMEQTLDAIKRCASIMARLARGAIDHAVTTAGENDYCGMA